MNSTYFLVPYVLFSAYIAIAFMNNIFREDIQHDQKEV